jgi:hypothetical protein
MRSFRSTACPATAAAVTALALGLLGAYASSPARASAGVDVSPAANPIGGGGSVELEPVTAPAQPPRTARLVFACVGDGVPVTFSDRPCGPSAETRQLRIAPAAASRGGAPDVGPPQAAARARNPVLSRPPPATVRDRGDGGSARPDGDRSTRDAQCQRLEEAVAALDQHMRAGYSARESGRLWSRWREAKERLRKSGC